MSLGSGPTSDAEFPPPPSHYRGGVGRQSGLAAAQGGVILVVGRVPRHLGHRAAGAPERPAAVLAPDAAPLGDAVPRADASARPRHDKHPEDAVRYVQDRARAGQEEPDALVPPHQERDCSDVEGDIQAEVNDGDHQEYVEGRRGLGEVALAAQPGEFEAVHDLSDENLWGKTKRSR